VACVVRGFSVRQFLYAARAVSILAVFCIVAALIGGRLASPAWAQDSPKISMSFGASSIVVGESTSLTFQIIGTNEVTGLGFSHSLPPGFVVASPNGFGGFDPPGACAGGTVTATPASGSIVLSGARLARSSTPSGCTFSVNVTAISAGIQNNSVTVLSDQGPGNTWKSSITIDPASTSIELSSPTDASTSGQSVTFTGKVTVNAPGRGAPTGTVTFTHESGTLGTDKVSADGTAILSLSTLGVGERSLVAVYDGDRNFTGSTSLSVKLVVRRASTRTVISSSAERTIFGEPIMFTATVSGPSGVPTGAVRFQDGPTTLGSIALSADGTARLSSSKFLVGNHTVTAEYEGDGTFVGSSSPALTQVVDKSPTTTILIASANSTTAGQPIGFTASVTGAGGTPTGIVTFNEGSTSLGNAILSSDGTGTFSISTLTTGNHTIVAVYGGSPTLASSASTALMQAVQPPIGTVDSFWSGLILLLAIVFVALLLPLRRIPFLIVGRVFRTLSRVMRRLFRTLSRPVARLLRLLRIISRKAPKPKPAVAAEGVIGVSVGAVSRAFALGSETDLEIATDFDTSSVEIQRNRQLFCSWLSPVTGKHVAYDEKQAELDLKEAIHFFNTSIPMESNAQNLYEDIEGAFIVKMFQNSDKPCFHVLSEFKKTINANVMILAVLFSAIVSVVVITNVLFSTSIDFHRFLQLVEALPINVDLLVTKLDFNPSKEGANKLVFGALSCWLGYMLMWLFYHLEYKPCQRNNGQNMNPFLLDYFSNINSQFRDIKGNVKGAALADKPARDMTRETVLWITNLRWMAFRVFFIEQFLRGILFQVYRNSSYYLVFIPPLFAIALVAIAYAFNIRQLRVFDTSSAFWQQSSFYLFFVLLLLAYYRYLRWSLSYIWESIKARDWFNYEQLNIQDAMTETMAAYVQQLVLWREAFRGRGAPPPSAPTPPPSPATPPTTPKPRI
jgi:Big-like domain-containing protein